MIRKTRQDEEITIIKEGRRGRRERKYKRGITGKEKDNLCRQTERDLNRGKERQKRKEKLYIAGGKQNQFPLKSKIIS